MAANKLYPVYIDRSLKVNAVGTNIGGKIAVPRRECAIHVNKVGLFALSEL